MKKLSTGWKIFLFSTVLIWVFILAAVFVSNEDTPEDVAKQKIEKLFDPWDGSHRELTKVIKSNLRDPDTYEHIETTCEIS